MASNIDITKPVSGAPSTESVRSNFAIAKTEIEAIQVALATVITQAQVIALINAAIAAAGLGTGVVTGSNIFAFSTDFEMVDSQVSSTTIFAFSTDFQSI